MKNEETVSNQKAQLHSFQTPEKGRKLSKDPESLRVKGDKRKKRAVRNKEKLCVMQRSMATHGNKGKSAKILSRTTTSRFHF